MLSPALCVLVTQPGPAMVGYGDVEHSYPGSRETGAQALGDRQDRRKTVRTQGRLRALGGLQNTPRSHARPLEVI